MAIDNELKRVIRDFLQENIHYYVTTIDGDPNVHPIGLEVNTIDLADDLGNEIVHRIYVDADRRVDGR